MNVFRIVAEQLRQGPVSFPVKETPKAFGIEDEEMVRFEDPIVGELTAMIASQTVIIRGELRTFVTAACSRCLDPVRVPVRAKVELSYIHDPRMLQLDRYPELFGEDTAYFDGEVVAPAPELREVLLLEMPPFPACELEPDETCPVTGRDMSKRTFGDTQKPAKKPAPEPAKPADRNTWKNQIQALRDQLAEQPRENQPDKP
ncbi:MAG: DUF177 domain-containing protein [Candidatus Sumerlaeia bacterium]|nr:DUF177 domain-containing protein [Candidatus Sumerlaeia bacterium]